MASRRFFGYDPYDYYYPYYHRQQQPATAARNIGRFFPAAAEPAAAVPVRRRPAPNTEAANPAPRTRRTVSIPVHFVGSDPELPAAVPENKRTPSAEEAAVRLQAAARGFLARRAVRALRAVEREAEEIAGKVTREAEELRGDARSRVAVGEALMRLLLRLDAVRGAREYRRRVAKRVLALQDAVDALEARPAAPVVAAAAEEPEPEAAQAAAADGEMAGEGVAAPEEEELPDATEPSGGETEACPPPPAEAGAEMEVDGDSRAAADEQPCAADETEQATVGANQGGGDNTSGDAAAAEGEWDMVTEEAGPEQPPRQEPAGEEEARNKAATEAGGGLDTEKVMQMVAALCERSAKQCTVIGALAERVDALERAVRRVEDAERRRRRAKKLKKEGRGSSRNKCYVD